MHDALQLYRRKLFTSTTTMIFSYYWKLPTDLFIDGFQSRD